MGKLNRRRLQREKMKKPQQTAKERQKAAFSQRTVPSFASTPLCNVTNRQRNSGFQLILSFHYLLATIVRHPRSALMLQWLHVCGNSHGIRSWRDHRWRKRNLAPRVFTARGGRCNAAAMRPSPASADCGDWPAEAHRGRAKATTRPRPRPHIYRHANPPRFHAAT